MDLDCRIETVLGSELEPVPDPRDARGPAGDGVLVWYGLTGARVELTGADGSFAPAIATNGSILAFSRSDNVNTDVFAVSITRQGPARLP